MAHAAALEQLVSGLVVAVTGTTADETRFTTLKDGRLKTLRGQSHTRTNQFEIKERLAGLVEKFSVRNRDDLSEALESRLKELPSQSKWLPEILSLFLALSDRPLEKTRVDDIKRLQTSTIPDQDLTWDEIIADDPYDEADLWQNIDRGYHSSGDEDVENDAGSDGTASTQATSVHEQDVLSVARLHLLQPDGDALSAVRRNVEARDLNRSLDDDTARVTELYMIREMLACLRGLPSKLLATFESPALPNVSKRVVTDISNRVTETAGALDHLRNWINTQQSSAYPQSMQERVRMLLSEAMSGLCRIDARYVDIKSNKNVSVIEVETEAYRNLRPLLSISSILQDLPELALGGSGFTLLDTFYDEACTAQLVGDDALYIASASVFLSGLQTYLRTADAWLDTGEVSFADSDTFFVDDIDRSCVPSEAWHQRFKLKMQHGNAVHAPKCVHPFVADLFACGKTRMFMRLLSQDTDYENDMSAPACTFGELADDMSRGARDILLPFAELVSNMLQAWLTSARPIQPSLLCASLLQDHGFTKILSAVPYLFFSKDGAAFQACAQALVDRVKLPNRASPSTEKFLFNELVHTAYEHVPHVEHQNLFVEIPNEGMDVIVGSAFSKLSAIRLGYNYPWEIQNITRVRSSEVHTKIFTLTLQLHCANTNLAPQLLGFRSAEAHSACTLKLRQNLLCFNNIVLHHVTATATSQHCTMQKRMQAAKNLDAMVVLWAEYVRGLELSLLLSPKLLTFRHAISRILEVSELLTSVTKLEAVRKAQSQFVDDVRFLIAGCRSVSRAGGETSLEALAEQLQWIVPAT